MSAFAGAFGPGAIPSAPSTVSSASVFATFAQPSAAPSVSTEVDAPTAGPPKSVFGATTTQPFAGRPTTVGGLAFPLVVGEGAPASRSSASFSLATSPFFATAAAPGLSAASATHDTAAPSVSDGSNQTVSATAGSGGHLRKSRGGILSQATHTAAQPLQNATVVQTTAQAQDVFDPLTAGSGWRGRGRGGARGFEPSSIARGRGRGAELSGQRQSEASPQQAAAPSAIAAGHPISKLFELFMSKLLSLSMDPGKQDDACGVLLEKALFHLDWKASPPPTLVKDMVHIALQLKPPSMKTKLERWAVVFYLGCCVNLLEKDLILDRGHEGDDRGSHDWQSIMRLALQRANILSETCQELFIDSRRSAQELASHGQYSDAERVVPYSCLVLILRRIRQTFELAASVGFYELSSQESQLIGAVVRWDSSAGSPMLRPLIETPATSVAWTVARTTAAIIGENAALRNSTELTKHLDYAASFHVHCPGEVGLRCMLYYRCAQMILQMTSFTPENLAAARHQLASALLLCPDEHHNTQLIARLLTGVSLALGFVPEETWLEQHKLHGLFGDVAAALRTANYKRYEATVDRLLPDLVEAGVASLVQHARMHVRTALVLSYFMAMGRRTQLDIRGLLEYIGEASLPPHIRSVAALSKLWLMPLLMERFINGTVDGTVMVLSKGRPFEWYDISGAAV